MSLIRFEAATAGDDGLHVGIFGLANVLARSGQISTAEREWLGDENRWYEAAYPDPAPLHPDLFDRATYPRATCWFRLTARSILRRIPRHLALLDRYEVAWRVQTRRRRGSFTTRIGSR